jgi:hypothetical protein
VLHGSAHLLCKTKATSLGCCIRVGIMTWRTLQTLKQVSEQLINQTADQLSESVHSQTYKQQTKSLTIALLPINQHMSPPSVREPVHS